MLCFSGCRGDGHRPSEKKRATHGAAPTKICGRDERIRTPASPTPKVRLPLRHVPQRNLLDAIIL